MLELVSPTVRVRHSFLAAMDEFAVPGPRWPTDTEMIEKDLAAFGSTWHDEAGFRAFVDALRADALEETRRPEGFVPSTFLWLVNDDEFLGRLSIRHRLTPYLLELGGSIGYYVRRSARGRGYASEMLRRALPVAADLGIEKVLITCDHDNVGSRRVIEKNGGVLEDRRGAKLRFWVPTG